MIEKDEPFAEMRAMYVKKKPKYATFTRRMWASTFDSMIAYFTLDPMVSYFLNSSAKSEVAAPSPDLDIQKLADINLQSFDQSALLADMGGGLKDSLWNFGIEYFAQTAVLLIVIAICWRLWDATPGKMICKIEVVDADTELPMSDKQILLRCFGYIVACAPLFIGIIWIGLDKRKQGWHDKIANSVVIIKDNEE